MQPPLKLESRAQALSDDFFHLNNEAFSAHLAENVEFSFKVGLIHLNRSIQSDQGHSKGKSLALDRIAQHAFDIASSVIVKKLICYPIENQTHSEMIEFLTRETEEKRGMNRFYEYSGHFMVTFFDDAAGPVKVIRIELNYTGEEYEKLAPNIPPASDF